MIRIREITDPDLRRQIVELLSEQRGIPAGAFPEWFELDDADFVDLLNELKLRDHPEPDDDPRM